MLNSAVYAHCAIVDDVAQAGHSTNYVDFFYITPFTFATVYHENIYFSFSQNDP